MYQTMNPDNLASSSVRKCNHLKLSKEEQNCPGNGRITSSTSTTTTTVTNSQQQNNHQQDHHNHNHNHQIGIHLSNTNHIQNQNQTHESSNNLSNSGSGDVLLQWGQRKRSRWCSRTEGRSMSSSEKHQNHIMPPPSQPSTSSNNNGGGGSCRSGGSTRVRPNPKDGSGFLPTKNRNLGDQNQMGCTNSASPSKNGGAGNSSRAISRSSVGKRSPSCIEKKISSGSGSIRKVKSDDSLPHTSNGNHHMESNHGEHHENGGGHTTTTTVRSPLTEPDKGNGEVVEWPRIYISLSRKEKEDDFYAMKGTKLPHRPKKRAKAVDRALQYCFPGLWLSDLTRARYEVRERKSTKKPKRRGLKGLESMESESE